MPARRPHWSQLSDDALLDLRLCDLRLRLKGTMLETCIRRLYAELDERGLRFRPHFWISNEWFSPDGIPGIAVPFYLCHPRLALLERRQMLEVEGGTVEWCMKILRHECGHAIDTAFHLRRRADVRRVFGSPRTRYPDTYTPEPQSKRFVLHLNWWYAQSHPLEDFAETFAVWLKPARKWRQAYRGWPALAKLELVDDLMRGIAGRRPVVTDRSEIDSLHDLRTKLRTHYRQRRERYDVGAAGIHDRDLRRLFSDDPRHRTRETAARFLRRLRPELRERVAFWTGQHQYTVEQVIDEMIKRCQSLGLRRARPEHEVRLDAIALVTAHTVELVHTGRFELAL